MSDISKFFEELNNLDETYFPPNKLDKHYNDHVAKDWKSYLNARDDKNIEPLSKEEYDEESNRLSQEPVYSSDYNSQYDVIGFVGKHPKLGECIYKFRKSLSELVIYKAKKDFAHTLTYYKITNYNKENKYNNLKKQYYLRDIKPLDDYYNR